MALVQPTGGACIAVPTLGLRDRCQETPAHPGFVPPSRLPRAELMTGTVWSVPAATMGVPLEDAANSLPTAD